MYLEGRSKEILGVDEINIYESVQFGADPNENQDLLNFNGVS